MSQDSTSALASGGVRDVHDTLSPLSSINGSPSYSPGSSPTGFKLDSGSAAAAAAAAMSARGNLLDSKMTGNTVMSAAAAVAALTGGAAPQGAGGRLGAIAAASGNSCPCKGSYVHIRRAGAEARKECELLRASMATLEAGDKEGALLGLGRAPDPYSMLQSVSPWRPRACSGQYPPSPPCACALPTFRCSRGPALTVGRGWVRLLCWLCNEQVPDRAAA